MPKFKSENGSQPHTASDDGVYTSDSDVEPKSSPTDEQKELPTERKRMKKRRRAGSRYERVRKGTVPHVAQDRNVPIPEKDDIRSNMEWHDAIQSVFNLQWKKFARESLDLTETEFQNCYEQIPNTNYERSYQALQKWHQSLDSTEDKEALLFDTLKAAYQRQLILKTFQHHMNIFEPTKKFSKIAACVTNTTQFIQHLGLDLADIDNFIITQPTGLQSEMKNNCVEKWKSKNVDYPEKRSLQALQNLITEFNKIQLKGNLGNEITDGPSTTAAKDEALINIRENLKAIYMASFSTLCPIPWMTDNQSALYKLQDVFISLKARHLKIKQQSDVILREEEDVSIQNLLDAGVSKDEVVEPRNILIEGEPGGGKSTLCQMIALQWAKGVNCVNTLDTYSLVIFIQASLIKQDDGDIYAYIRRELLLDHDNIVDTIKHLKMLILVDGYDELSGNPSIITEMLRKKKCYKSTVIVTSRYGHKLDLIPFTTGFKIANLTSQHVTKFHEKMSLLNPNIAATKIDLDTHPLGPILAIPLFLWLYYLLGKESFHGVNSSTRTKLFKHITDSILAKAVTKLNTSQDECQKALKDLKKLAYDCMSEDRLYFSGPLSELAAKIGLVKYSNMKSDTSSSTVYAFTHKVIMEFLAAQYIAEQDGNLLELIKAVPELQSEERRRTSLVLYFLCGLLKKTDASNFEMIFHQFIPYVEDSTEHTQHFGLQCIAEMEDIGSVGNLWQGRVSKVLTLNGSQCSQYCPLGVMKLKKLSGKLKYDLNTLTLVYSDDSGTNMLGDSTVMNEVTRYADQNTLRIEKPQTDTVLTTLHSYYVNVILTELHINSSTAALPQGFKLRFRKLDASLCSGLMVGQLISDNCDQLNCLKMHKGENWREQDTTDMRLSLTTMDSRQYRLGSCPIKLISIRDWVPGEIAPLLISVCYEHLQSLELYHVTLTDLQIKDVANGLNTCTSFRKLKLWNLLLEQRRLENVQRIRLLESLNDSVVTTLEDLGVMCRSKEGLKCVARFIIKSNINTFRYGRLKQTPYKGDIEYEHEYQFWKSILTEYNGIENIYLYDKDLIDSEASRVALKSVMADFSDEQKSALRLKRVAKVEYEREEDYVNLDDFIGLAPLVTSC